MTAAWDRFVRESWEQRPLLVAGDLASQLPAISADELFRAVIACCARFLADGRQKVRFYVDGDEIDIVRGGHAELLPVAADRSFERYNHRITVQRGIPDYALVVADWHQFERPLWDRLLAKLEPLFARVGISAARMDTQMFLGTYRKTPFGVHVDATTAFHFPVVGTKTMRFWPGDEVERTPELRGAHDYAGFLAGSQAVTAAVGEAIYWPSDRWHIGESDGSFVVTWGTGYWVGHDMRELAMLGSLRALDRLASEAPIPRDAKSDMDDGVLDDVLRELAGLIASDQLRELAVQRWLEHHSASGFLRVPPPLDPPSLPPGARVVRKPGYRILAREVTRETTCIAVAGRSRIFPASPGVHALIEQLQSGASVAVAALPAEAGDALDFILRGGGATVEC